MTTLKMCFIETDVSLKEETVKCIRTLNIVVSYLESVQELCWN